MWFKGQALMAALGSVGWGWMGLARGRGGGRLPRPYRFAEWVLLTRYPPSRFKIAFSARYTALDPGGQTGRWTWLARPGDPAGQRAQVPNARGRQAPQELTTRQARAGASSKSSQLKRLTPALGPVWMRAGPVRLTAI